MPENSKRQGELNSATPPHPFLFDLDLKLEYSFPFPSPGIMHFSSRGKSSTLSQVPSVSGEVFMANKARRHCPLPRPTHSLDCIALALRLIAIRSSCSVPLAI
jgi:hypothetical protein